MKTWLGPSAGDVSETMTLVVSGEAASTLPGRFESWLTEFAVGSSTARPTVPNNPEFVPRYPLVPNALNTREFGVAGKVRKVPRVFAGAVIGTAVLKQLSVVPQLVLLTYTVALLGLPGLGSIKVTTFSG